MSIPGLLLLFGKYEQKWSGSCNTCWLVRTTGMDQLQGARQILLVLCDCWHSLPLHTCCWAEKLLFVWGFVLCDDVSHDMRYSIWQSIRVSSFSVLRYICVVTPLPPKVHYDLVCLIKELWSSLVWWKRLGLGGINAPGKFAGQENWSQRNLDSWTGWKEAAHGRGEADDRADWW